MRTLRDFRKSMGLSQSDMAEKCHLSFGKYQRLESDPTNVKLSELLLICGEFGVDYRSIDWTRDNPEDYQNKKG